MAFQKFTKKTYASILADGLIHVECTNDHPDAVVREYELRDGTKGSKVERQYNSISGYITNVEYHENDYGASWNVTISDKEEGDITLTLNTESPFCDEFLKRLPNIDLTKEASLVPYSFEDNKGKNKKGLIVWQDQDGDGKKEKIENFFYAPAEVEGERGKNINGFPEPEGDTKTYDKNDWKVYFIKVRKFLKKYTEDNIVEKFSSLADSKLDMAKEAFGVATDNSLDDEELNISNIPY